MLRNLFWLAMDDAPIKPCLSTSTQASLSTGDCNLKTNTALITNPLNHVNFQKNPTLTKYYHKNLMFNSNTRANHLKLQKQAFHSFSGTPQSLFHTATRQMQLDCAAAAHTNLVWQTGLPRSLNHLSPVCTKCICLHCTSKSFYSITLPFFNLPHPSNTKHIAPHQRTKAFVL